MHSKGGCAVAITIDHVKKSFGERSVIRDAHFTLPERGRICFFGPSGCGKTTLLRIICGLESPDGGSVVMPQGTRFACHFQEDRVLPWYTALDNLTLVTGSDERSHQWLDRMQLASAASLYPDELSGGMRRRVSLARALAYDSDVLVLDEPLRELDEATAASVLRLIDQSVGDRLLLLVTHDRRQAEALGCHVIDLPV